MRKNIFFIAFLTLTMLWSSACTSKNSGHSSISNSNSNTTSSESASSETPSLDCAHNYQLNDGQTLYVCSLCGDSMPSGSGSLSNDGNDFIGDDYVSDYEEKYDMQSKNYLFIGSSAANGFHSAADPTRTSMATMMRDDYLTADYTIYENGALVEYKSVYLRKIVCSGTGIRPGAECANLAPAQSNSAAISSSVPLAICSRMRFVRSMK